MDDETTSPSEETSANTDDEHGKGKKVRQRSTIGFPYMDLNEAIGIARAIHANAGLDACDDKQLAPWMDLSEKSSGYRVRIAAARLFELIESPSPGAYRLTKEGLEIIDASKDRNARVRAFLSVPLFSAVFERWGGNQLPPAAALERELVGLGVAAKQKDRARQIFERSADQAGFFEHGRDRLVKPGTGNHEKPPPPPPGGGNGDLPPLHPFIQGLLQLLPPEPGTEWALEDQVKWLTTAAHIFGLMYRREGEIKITADKPEHRPPRPTGDPQPHVP